MKVSVHPPHRDRDHRNTGLLRRIPLRGRDFGGAESRGGCRLVAASLDLEAPPSSFVS